MTKNLLIVVIAMLLCSKAVLSSPLWGDRSGALCPFVDGAVVYEARALYNLVNETIVIYNDNNCSKIGFSFRTNADSTSNTNSQQENDLYNELINNEMLSKQKFKPLVEYSLYPNPAQTLVNITSYITNETVKIKISDAAGKVVLEKYIIISQNSGKLELNLISGIYFVEIINKANKHEFKKLIISNY